MCWRCTLEPKKLTHAQNEEYSSTRKVTANNIERLKKILSKKELNPDEVREKSTKKSFLQVALIAGFSPEQANFLWDVINAKADQVHDHREIIYGKK